MFDFLDRLKDAVMSAGEEVVADATEEVEALTEEFGLDEFGTEGLW